MEQNNCHHRNCQNYAPVDVIKGICHLSKNTVDASGASCDKFEQLPVCRTCKHYAATDRKLIGSCNANRTKFFTYPDLVATTCEWFAWTNQ